MILLPPLLIVWKIVLLLNWGGTLCLSLESREKNDTVSTNVTSLPSLQPFPNPHSKKPSEVTMIRRREPQRNMPYNDEDPTEVVPLHQLKETTKIVTIKIYPPPANSTALLNSTKPLTIGIPKPFDGIDGESFFDKSPAVDLKTNRAPHNKDMALEHTSAELNNIDYSLLCRDGPPYLAEGKPLYCAVSSGCPAGYWCHTGSSKATTFCCPHSKNDYGCSLPMVSGYGSGQMERWYFDLNDGVCKLFVYTGYGGNQNNFLTYQDCADSCGLTGSTESTGSHETISTAKETMPASHFVDNTHSWHTESSATTSANPLPHIPLSTAATITFATNQVTQKKDNNVPTARCFEQGGVIGTGTAFTTRWAFDAPTNLCKSFIYAGLGGTQNNFYSEFECAYICKGFSFVPQPVWTTPEPVSICHLPYNKGTGYSPVLRWFYNSQVDDCQQFTYMGFAGNKNNFVDEETCRTTCRPHESLEEDDPCYLKPNFGNGTENITRFYYDAISKDCESFQYSGTGGNANNFLSVDICRAACVIEFGQSLEFPRQHPKPMDKQNIIPAVPIAVKNLNIMETKNIAPMFPMPTYNPDVKDLLPMGTLVVSGPEPVGTKNFIPQAPFPSEIIPTGSTDNKRVSIEPVYVGKLVPVDNKNIPVLPVPYINVNPTPPTNSTNVAPVFIPPFVPPNPVPGFPNQPPFVPNNQFPGWHPVPAPVFQPNMNINPMPGQNGYPLDVMPVSSHSGPNMPNGNFGGNFVPNIITDAGTALPVNVVPRPNFSANPATKSPIMVDQLNNLVLPFNQSVHVNGTRFVNITSLTAAGICNGFIPLGEVNVCGPDNDFQCPPRFVCHIAVPFSLCCPQQAAVSMCNMNSDVGTGDNKVTRWHYNAKTGHCDSFFYKGLNGNANNFLTFDQCINACGSNPCGYGKPLRVNDANIHCGSSPHSSCPMNYYCHIGAVVVNTVCCPRQGNPCVLPMNPGTGSDSLQRYFFDSASKKCQIFTYTGHGGNENNFLNEPDCLSTCHVRRQSSSPCGTGQPAHSGKGELMFCSTNSAQNCPPKFFCHIGSGPETTVCCPMSGGASACKLPLRTGRGNAVLARWYHDSGTSSCKAFTYTGLGGNENNFLSLNDCRTICPEFDNPCPAGRPPVGADIGQVSYCSAANPSCPDNYWCHFGSDKQTTVCCPFSVNPCNLPRVEGTGTSQLPRYYFDRALKQCRPLLYTGKGGNQNNFISKSDCEAACPIVDNPCAEGMPALDAEGQPQFCSTANPDICPDGHWCHVGPNAASTLCCPGASDPCRLPVSKGSGQAVLNRWYYNTDTKTCLSFTYTGRNGNQNNFLSLGECRIRCPEFQNPCSTGQPHISLSGQITHCGATAPTLCPTTFWCHIGATLESSVCCPGASNPCELPLEEGNGNANLVRYHYDNNKQICKQFQYSGMGGNENSFLTVSECEQRCPVFRNPCSTGDAARDKHGHVIPCSVSDVHSCPKSFWCHVGADEQSTLCCPGAGFPCTEPLQVGNGASSLPRFYYNSLTQQCLPFTYSGTGGNQNNYLSRADCEKSCPVFVNPCAQGQPATGPNGQYVVCTSSTPNICPANYWCHVGDLSTNSVCCPGDEIPCVLPLSTGNGNAALTRWYFDNNVRRCARFPYSGMGGNPNNFLTLQDCQLRCPEYENPCQIGDPAQSESGGVMFCSTAAPTCPDDHWCHIGADPDSTVCCLGDANPCTQPMLPGSGTAKLNRWYFNQNTKQCLQFTYTGKRGNQNNFLSEIECVTRCPVFKNPCSMNMPPNHIVYCTSQSRDVCPAGYWCHVGATVDTSVCCPGAGDPCTLPVSQGTFTGSKPIVRWHFDTKEKRCKQFQYAGVAGNQNNFVTQQECQQKCPEFVNPCLRGEPYRERQNGIVRFCSRNNPTDCPQQFWCHFGANSQSTVCCPGAGDPCTLPLSVGNGPASLPRWYFNVLNRQCQQFTYSGLAGNQNNFQTQRECQTSCPEFSNPCSEGTPLTAINGQITYCTAQNPNVCPVKYFCHVGATPDTSVCCPTVGDPCNLPRLVGRGNVALQRWHFNSLTRRCESFTYSGAGGNANNFVTLETCRIRCQEFSNPCEGEPYRSAGGQIVYCNADSVCPPKYFCHYGIDTTSTMCCPVNGPDDPCLLPVIIGIGTAKLTRWYYNIVTQTCASFVYSGMGGNENNFRTLSECQSRCTPVANPCSPGTTPFMDGTGKPQQCSSVVTGFDSILCPNGFYCHAGADPTATVCCPLQGNPCDLPQSVGTGTAVLQRWYFDQFAGHCEMFTYTGIGGNANNFMTELECHRKCGSGHLPRQSAKNNFQSKCPHGEPILSVLGIPQVCVKQPQGPHCPTHFLCTVNNLNDGICCADPKIFCTQPLQSGSDSCTSRIGSENTIRYGYNQETDACYPFRYSGCGGNLNNFASLKQCTEICSSKKLLPSDEFVTLNDDSSGGINGTDGYYFNETLTSSNVSLHELIGNHRPLGWLQSMVSWFKNLSQKR